VEVSRGRVVRWYYQSALASRFTLDSQLGSEAVVIGNESCSRYDTGRPA
jgi:hypothetical protein